MRRRPDDEEAEFEAPLEALYAGARRKSTAQSVHGVQPFFASGGMSYWITFEQDQFFPNRDGVQLVAFSYVPDGRQGFVKELRIAPYCPSPLCDPWSTSGTAGYGASWRQWQRSDPNELGDLPFMGDLWRAPMGWEAAFDDFSDPLPTWTWALRFLQGDLRKLRGQGQLNIPPFATGNPQSWFLVPSIPVPSSAYPAGLPGQSAGPQWDQQRMQILPTDKVSMHVPVPPNTTVMLFAQWSQSDVQPLGGDAAGVLPYVPSSQFFEGRVPPIGPSVGSLLGYTQALSAKAARDNLEHGWGG
jgi:hypothetical protein